MTKLDVAGTGMTSERTRLRLIERLRKQGISNESVLHTMLEVPRHLFVEEAIAHRAYEDTALPIGFGQTISQPYIVAKMTSALIAESPCNRILEIGTGSGYQAAVLSRLAKEVVTVERHQPLLKRARNILGKMNYRNVVCLLADGYLGVEKYAPYDGIIVTAAPEIVPEALLHQLVEGGRLVIPVGDKCKQDLQVYTRVNDEFKSLSVELVNFVPLLPGIER